MNNYSSFLDTTNQGLPNMPRSAPSPSSSPSPSPTGSHQPNGINPASSIPMVNGLPSGGQQTDMNHLWSVVQQLSEVLAENRAQTAGIVNGVGVMQARGVEVNGVNGVVDGSVNGEASRQAQIADLMTRLSNAETQISELGTANGQLRTLLTDYENALALLLDKLRPYAFSQTQANLSLHKYYDTLLEQERATSMQLRLEHAEWQAGLGRVADYARLALKSQSEGDVGFKREIKALREENRVLRQLVGWEERGDSSEGEEEKEL